MKATELTLFRGGSFATWMNGENVFLDDSFDNGNAFQGPNFPNGSASIYSLVALDVGANPNMAAREEGGALLLDSSYAASVPGATGNMGKALKLRLSTNTTNPNGGLNRSTSFAAALGLSLKTLPAAGSSWGLRLSDSFSNSNDQVELFVYTAIDGSGSHISFRKQDFEAHRITNYGSTKLALPSGSEGLVLVISHNEAGSDQIFGNYGYLDEQGHLMGELHSFETSGTAFRGETHTRIEIRATQAVPEPSTWALWFAGAGLLLAGRRLSAAAPSR